MSLLDKLKPDTPLKKTAAILAGAVIAYSIYSKCSKKPLLHYPKRTSDPESNKIYCITSEESAQRSSNISDIRYSLILNLQKGKEFLGHCRITFLVADPSFPVWLDFNSDEILFFKINDSSTVPHWERSKLYLDTVKVGANSVDILYKRKYANDGKGLHHFVDPIDNEEYIFSHFEPFYANRMFPCFDQPDLKANFKISVLAPSDWNVVSNEPCISVTQPNNQMIFRLGDTSSYTLRNFEETSIISSYLVAVCAGPYYEARYDINELNIPLGFYCRKSLKDILNPELYLSWTISSFKFYQEYFNMNYPFKKYDQVFVPEFNSGAMENVGCVTYREDYLFRDTPSAVEKCRVANTFLHEMAHMWFGNLVTMVWWDDLWLNESFATFMSHLNYSKSLSSEYPDVWLVFLKRKRAGYVLDQISTSHPISTTVQDTSQTSTNFDAISYIKGAAVLKQLRFIIGHDLFKRGIQRYLYIYKHGNAVCKSFIDAIEEEILNANIDFDIQGWADSWIKKAGLNTLEAEYEIENGVISSFKIKQSADAKFPELRRHKILIGLFDENMNAINNVEAIVLPQEFTELESLINAPAPACVILNIDDHDYCKIRIDNRSLEIIKNKLHLIKENLTRQLIWSAIQDMVRDCLLPAPLFLQIVISNFEYETEEGIGGFILELAHASINLRISKQVKRDEYFHQIFEAILNKIQTNPNLKEYEKHLFFFLRADSDVLRAVRWLEDSSEINFTLTQGNRWSIIKAFSRIDIAARELVAKELLNDQSNKGKLAALYCSTAYPDADLKQTAWNSIVNGEKDQLSKQERRAFMSGFINKKQQGILKPFAQMYFDFVPEIIAKKNAEFAIDFCTNMFPSFESSRDLIPKIKALLGVVPKDYPQIKRFLNEKADILEQNIKAKELAKSYLNSLA